MCGVNISQNALFVAVTVNDFVPSDHPLRVLLDLINETLKHLTQMPPPGNRRAGPAPRSPAPGQHSARKLARIPGNCWDGGTSCK